MRRSSTDAAGDGSAVEVDAGRVVLSRTTERRDQGVVLRFSVENEGKAPERIAFEQDLPPADRIEDARFRSDAAPEEWVVDSDRVRGETRLAPGAASTFVFGLRLGTDTEPPTSFPAPTVAPAAKADAIDGDRQSADDDVTATVREVLGTNGTTATDGGQAPGAGGDPGVAVGPPEPRDADDDDDAVDLEAAVEAAEAELDETGETVGDAGLASVGEPSPTEPSNGTETDDQSIPEIDLATPGEAAEDDGSGTERDAEGDADPTAGPTAVRLRHIESRLSKLEAYEDALAAFIEEDGTAEAVRADARAATEAVEGLRTEVAALRETTESARAERERLREELATLREDVAEVQDLRSAMLDALSAPEPGVGTEGAAD